MTMEMTWKTAPNIQAPAFSTSTNPIYTGSVGKYHAWFLVQALIGADPLGAVNSNLVGVTDGFWHLQWITSGSTTASYVDGNTSYRTSNLWMDSDKSFSNDKVPAMFYANNNAGYDKPWYDPRLSTSNFYSPNYWAYDRGLAVLKSPAINGRNYYMTVDLSSNFYGESPFVPRIYLTADQPVTSSGATVRPTANEHFSYMINNQDYEHVRLNFSRAYVQHKHSLSLASDGSFYYYHTWNTADTFRSLFAFTGLKNYSSGDPRAVMEIRLRDSEVNSNNYNTYPFGNIRGFIPNSFTNMSSAAVAGTLPVATFWYVDSNVISRSTSIFKTPRHDGNNTNPSVTSASCGLHAHILNVWDYNDVYSPLYGQSNINSQFGEMPVIIGNEQINQNNGYQAMRGRVPDFKYAPNNLVQGSVRPSGAPFEYVKVGGFWCPWSTSVAATM